MPFLGKVKGRNGLPFHKWSLIGRFRCRKPGVLGLYVRRISVVSRRDLGGAAGFGGAFSVLGTEGTEALVGFGEDAARRTVA